MENGIRHLKLLLVVAGVVACCVVPGFAADVKVIANVSIGTDALSIDELRNIFMEETNTLRDGSHVEPVFLRSGAANETFLKEFLKENADSLKYHFGSMVFTGKGSMPKSFNSDADVLSYVSQTRGAVGYVSASASTDGVKVLEVRGETIRSDRSLLTRVEPEYPETLRQMHIGGVVRLQVVISPQGSVLGVTLLGGNPILGEAAIEAVKQWVYAPRPVRSTIEVSIPFR